MSGVLSRRLRRGVQWLCLFGFLWLFLQTEYRGLDELPYPVSLLFRIDPLAALADILAPGESHWRILWPALLLVVLTALCGRFFCGWICPLGTTLDLCGRLLGRPTARLGPAWRRLKYLLLFGLSAATAAGLQLIGLFDPLSIFLRSLTLSLYPVYNLLLNGLFDWAYASRLPALPELLNRAYPFFRAELMAFHQPFFELALFTFLVFAGILLLEKVERRFWCRNLCPLGALLGLCACRAPFRRLPEGACADCATCAGACRMGLHRDRQDGRGECILCLDCLDYCPQARTRFVWRRVAGGSPVAGVDLPRRSVLTALAAGAVAGPVWRTLPAQALVNPYLVRPPGAVAEEEFLRRCIRCGECMKVCIGGALHPALLQAGSAALWTPLLVARLGYCEYNCTLCGQVCPTGAIRRLPLAEKQRTVIGLAVIDRNRCLPFERGVECLVCEEHCPTGEKAIVFDERETLVEGRPRRLKFPRIVVRRCIGCGICETRCPVEGASAVRIIHEGESRRPRPPLLEHAGGEQGPYG